MRSDLKNSPRQTNNQPAVKPASVQDAASPSTDRKGIIQAVTTPLGFFALVVLVVEAILGSTVLFSRLTEDHAFFVVKAIIGIIVFLIVVVTLIAFVRPEVLSPETAKAVQTSREAKQLATQVQTFVNSQAFKDAIVDIIEQEVKPTAIVKRPAKGADSNG